MATIEAGIATVDITPPAGLHLAGFAARTEPAAGRHDALTARAIVIGETALVVADVIGIERQSSARIRAACGLPMGNVVVAATHTHGAPNAMPDRLGSGADPAFVEQLEKGCIAAIRQAAANRRPTRLRAGYGADPGVARNRRHEGGPVDPHVPVLHLIDELDRVFGVLVSYACHPTVLGADNRLMTGDYPHFLRDEIETQFPGAIAVFAQGCSGDINIGHSAKASWTTAPADTRTFANAERLGRAIGRAACAAQMADIVPVAKAREAELVLELDRPEIDLMAEAARWEGELARGGDPARALLLPHWIAWARANADAPLSPYPARVSVLDWGGAVLTAVPGEVFVEAGLEMRQACGDRPAFVLAYADDTPGYIPVAGEYVHSGYEVSEAYRFFGLPGRIASGSAERLVAGIKGLLAR